MGRRLIWILCFITLLKYTTSVIYVNDDRLPKTFIPIHYEISLLPDIGNKTFSGKEDIYFKISGNESNEEFTDIELNSYKLTIDETEVFLKENGTNKSIEIGAVGVYDKYEKLIISSVPSLQKHKIYLLQLNFKGNLSTPEESDGGLLISSYTDANGTESEYLVGKFFPAFARYVFPCFDEPYFKATISLSVTRSSEYNTISTTQKLRSTNGNNIHGEPIIWDIFRETPLIAPSSLGLFISKFAEVENKTNRINLLAPTEEIISDISQHDYWKSILDYSEVTLMTKFRLPSINYVFIPNLFKETFESWGIIYIRANKLLYQSNITDDVYKNILSTVKGSQKFKINVAKEIASQYFGDTVTPEWWDEIWLKDGISEYYGNFLAPMFERKWDFKEFMSGIFRSEILEYQSKNSDVEPIIENHSEQPIQELLKSINPQKSKKGGAILFMLMSAFSRTVFDPALIEFLKNCSLSTGTTEKLVELWQDELIKQNQTLINNLTVSEILNSWLYTKGVPLLSVTRKQEETGNETVIITQRKYGSFKKSLNEIQQSLDWYIPITYTTSEEENFDNTQPELWFGPSTFENQTQKSLTLHNKVSYGDWIIFNNKATGLYRVTYDPYNWNLIENQLKKNHSYINTLNRAQIVDDIFALASTGDLLYKDTLNIAKYLKNETELYPLSAAFKAFKKIKIMVSQDKDLAKYFTDYVKEIIENIYNNIGFFGDIHDDVDDILARSETLKWACDYDVSDCVENATNVMTDILSGDLHRWIRHDYLEAIFCGGIQNANNDTWMKVYDLYRKKSDILNEGYLLKALACSKNSQIIESYLKWIVTPNKLGNEEAFRVFHSVSKRQEYVNNALSFLTENVNNIKDLYGEKALSRFIIHIGRVLTTQNQYNQINSLKEQQVGKNVLLAINNTLEVIDSSITLLNDIAPEMESYFKESPKTTTTPPITEIIITETYHTDVTKQTGPTTQLPSTTPKALASHINYSITIMMAALMLILYF
ncbi:aminopeptidase N-like [Lycorma delicatula]|uniref:aminopeptidase N-like n=1 Tax=Lycorma delicatula TaxID=130591 RepID=UPI003F50EF9A